MKDENKDYVLGNNVTAHATARERRGTVRFAMEFALDDFAAIEAAADLRGISISDLVLEAVRDYPHQPVGPVRVTLAQGKSNSEHVQYQAHNQAEESRATESELHLRAAV